MILKTVTLAALLTVGHAASAVPSPDEIAKKALESTCLLYTSRCV